MFDIKYDIEQKINKPENKQHILICFSKRYTRITKELTCAYLVSLNLKLTQNPRNYVKQQILHKLNKSFNTFLLLLLLCVSPSRCTSLFELHYRLIGISFSNVINQPNIRT